MIAYAVPNQENTEKPQDLQHRFPIYKQKKSKSKTKQRLERMTPEEIFKYLNIWNFPSETKQDYIWQFKQYLERKVQGIALHQLEKTMRKPDFIKFFKYLKEKKNQEDDIEELESDTEVQQTMKKKQVNKYAALEKELEPFLNPRQYKKSYATEEKIEKEVTCEDFIIVQHSFKSIQEEGQTSISKVRIAQGLSDNKKFCQAFDINIMTLEYRLSNYPSKEEDRMDIDEFINFILYPQYQIQVQSKTSSNSSTKSMEFKGTNVTTQDMFDVLRPIFKYLDYEGFKIVDQLRYVKAIKADPLCKEFLFDPIFRLNSIEKEITLERYLYELEVQATIQKEKKITWDEFVNQMQNYAPLKIPNKDVTLRSQQLGGSTKEYDKLYKYEYLHLPTTFFHVMEKLFTRLDLKYGYFGRKEAIITQLRCSEDFMRFAATKVRDEPTNILNVETVEETLTRIAKEADNYLIYDELVDFFTVRGRPLILDLQMRGKQQTIKIQEAPKEIALNTQFKTGALAKLDSQNFLITIPENPRLTEQNQEKTIRQKWLEKELRKKKKQEQNEMQTRPKVKPVPWYVSDPLMERIERDKLERRQKIKEQLRAEACIKPFSFEQITGPKKRFEPAEPESFRYRARPVPKASSEIKYDQMMDDIRQRSEENIRRRMKELQDMIDEPDSIKNMLKRNEERKKSPSPYHKPYEEETFSPFRARNMPDFQRLHQEFDDELAAKKAQNQPTQFEPLNITNIQMRPTDYSEIINRESGYIKYRNNVARIDKNLKKILNTPPNQVYATRKQEDLIDFKRKQKVENQLKLINKDAEWKALKADRQKLLPKQIDKPKKEDPKADLGKKIREDVRWKREFHKHLEKQYEEEKKRMEKRIQKRPLIMYADKMLESNSDQEGEDSSYESGETSQRGNSRGSRGNSRASRGSRGGSRTGSRVTTRVSRSRISRSRG